MSPTRRLSVVALVCQPGQRTPIHDHVAWCIVGVYRGVEREIRYRLVEDGGEKCLQQTGSLEAHPGHVEALVAPAEDIHCVTAAGDENIERRGTSVYRRFDGLRELAAR